MTPAGLPTEPYAEITRMGRWVYSVTVHDGMFQWGPMMMGVTIGWSCFGRRWARWKARRALAAYLRWRERADEQPIRITAGRPS